MRNNSLLIILLQLLVSCAPLSQNQDTKELLAYLPLPEKQTILAQHLPVFIIERPAKQYNKIGTPKAKLNEKQDETIYVDTQKATIYVEERQVTTSSNNYTNLIYRIHFPKTPYGLFPFQIGAGNNVGLFIIITLNSLNQTVLYTTVHTCGCYLAFIPTTYLPKSAYPQDWPEKRQVVYTENLPALINFKNKPIQSTLIILIKDASHRVKDMWLSDKEILDTFETSDIAIRPLASLESLQINGNNKTTSFYETSGKRTGYVKESYKLLERLFISWWALDWRIGEDKKLSANKKDPPVFFTSLKPWARETSDLRDFSTFLTYWGWKL